MEKEVAESVESSCDCRREKNTQEEFESLIISKSMLESLVKMVRTDAD